MLKNAFLIILLSFLFELHTSYASYNMGNSKKVFFELTDNIKDKRFEWTRTLLSYPVNFGNQKIDYKNLILKEIYSGEIIPFQLSELNEANGFLKSATVNFVCGLPSGGSYKFELSVQQNPKKAIAKDVVSVLKTTNSYEIGNQQMKIHIPLSGSYSSQDIVPGPVMQLCRNGKWVGQSRIISPRQSVKSLSVELKEQGDLLVTARLIYRFDNGGEYLAIIKVKSECEYVDFEESVSNLDKDDDIRVEMTWKDLELTHRSSSSEYGSQDQKIDENIKLIHRGEDPAFTGPGRTENTKEDFLYSLCPQMFGDGIAFRTVSFSNVVTNEAIAIFVKDAGKWTSPEYSIWNYGASHRIHFRYNDGQLSWIFPLSSGSRSTAFMLCDKEDTRDQSLGEMSVLGKKVDHSTSKINLLRNRSAELSLDRIKDYDLNYNGRSIVPDLEGKNIYIREALQSPEADLIKSPREYLEKFWNDGFIGVWKGVVHPVSNRSLPHWIVPGYIKFQSQFTSEEREKVNAMLILLANVVAGEEVAPIKTMLGGHPNFMADWLFPLAAAAYLFPDHLQADSWSNEYSKFVELTGLYYSRPDVKSWNASGGRWTESLGVYNFAYLTPTSQGNQLLELRNGENVFANELTARLGKYLVGVTTSPVVIKGNESKQVIHPPMGAHSGKRGIPGSVYALGECLKFYDPLNAEYLMRIGGATADVKKENVNNGTDPKLKSAKFTGFGIVMRSGVGTPEEMSVFLQQIDKGPNYRWGFANEGGCGNIYYYAAGKSYSGHLREDAGDRRAQDAMFSCNTGVYRDKNFYSIGMSDLIAPFYNLDVAQYAKLFPRSGKDNYCTPEYRYRSVMMVGNDYIVIYDAVTQKANTRLSWSVGEDDIMPEITVIKGGSVWPTEYITREGKVESKGVLYQSHPWGGDRMTLVTHRKDVVYQKPRKTEVGDPCEIIRTATSTDYLFNNQISKNYSVDGCSFNGEVGLVRKMNDGSWQVVLLNGTSIKAGQVEITSDNAEAGLSLNFKTSDEISGKTYTESPANVTINFSDGFPSNSLLYMDGEVVTVKKSGNQLSFKLPVGAHTVQFSKEGPQPISPEIIYTINKNSQALICYKTVHSATSYEIEVSHDGGQTWILVGSSKSNLFTLKNLANGTKLHVRVSAANKFRKSPPSPDYPIYVTGSPPEAPDGLHVDLRNENPVLTWGEVLGISGYKLYRKARGEKSFRPIFTGRINNYRDKEVSLKDFNARVYEYAITAMNGNGEGKFSLVRNTDPASWKNFTPAVPYKFKRQSTYWQPPYVDKDAVPPMYYPE